MTIEEQLAEALRERDEARAELAALRKRVVEALPYPTDDDSDESRTAEEAIEMAVAERDAAYQSRDLAMKMWDEERAGDKLRELARERDEARAEVERLKAEAASSLAMARIADEKHGWKCAEVDVLRGVGCNEDGDGSCGVCRKCAYRRGAEAMREACAMLVLTSNAVHGRVDADALRALPIPEET